MPLKNTLPTIAYVGWMVPEKLRSRSPAFAVAGSLFQTNLIDSLSQASGGDPYVIGFRPVPMFPRGREIFVSGLVTEMENHLKTRIVPFVNVIFLKQITMAIAIFYYVMAWLWRNRFQPRCIIIYNVYLPQSLPVLIATWLLGGKPIALVADLPHNLNSQEAGWRRLLHKMNFTLEAQCLKYFAALVPITAQIAADYAPHLPALVVEGGVNLTCIDEAGAITAQDAEDMSEKLICMYSGSLRDYSGIELLLDAFHRIKSPKYRLWIFGKGPLEQAVRDSMKLDARIFYGGMLPHDQILQYQKKATVLINPRISSHWVTRYTFPSKLLEYMLSGRPVINTDLQGVPAEYHQYTLILKDESPVGLAQLIQEVCTKSASELDEFGQHAREFVVRNKNWTLQGQRIYDLMCKLTSQ